MKIRPPVKEYDPFAITQNINDYWARTIAYKRAKNANAGFKKFYFVDGPPFTAGKLHIGLARNKILKDCYLRFLHFQGLDVIDKPGFDMHGLPIEVKVEESLGINFKKEIEELGVERFVNTCKDYANDYHQKMMDQFKALGIWLDWEHSYLTADNTYMETVWRSIKEAHKKNLLEKQKQVTAWCPRCESPLAQGEVIYKHGNGHSVYLKIPIKGRRDEYLIVWTTSPWTFAGALAIGVNPNAIYARVAVRQGGRKSTIILLEHNVEEITKLAGVEAHEILETITGKELEKLGFFHPLMADIPYHKSLKGEWCHKVIALESVHESNTGCVYISPGLGVMDSNIGNEYSLPIFSPVDERGIFTTELGIKYAGQNSEEANNSILADMKALRFVLFDSKEDHKSGHCWRCESPIVHRATEQWFLKSNEVKDVMLKTIKGVSWTPERFGSTRQQDWIHKVNDWCISRQRYWGTPLPVWECIADVCGHVEVIGSFRDIVDANGYKEGMDLHRPWIDKISLECPKCGGLMKRVPDIVDVWFDSSISSWGQLGYPRKKKAFKELWPADWIAEGQDQSKGWFYNQILAGTILFNKIPFKKVLAHGFVHDEGGHNVNNSKSEFSDTNSVLSLHSADALRFYMLSIDPTESFAFNQKDLKKTHGMLNVLWNTYVFSSSYMNMDEWNPIEKSYTKIKSDLQPEDSWILSRIESLSHDVKREMEHPRTNVACKLIHSFIMEDLSRWYVKIIRERLWKEGSSPDKDAAYFTLKEVITKLTIIMSPMAPHISETIYQELGNQKLTVSMEPWPEVDITRLAEGMERSMNLARSIVRTSQKLRQELDLNLRWPVRKMTISASNEDVVTAVNMYSDIIKRQSNVKELDIVPEDQEWAGQELIVIPNSNVIGKAYKQRESKIARMLKVLPAKDIKSKIEAGEYHLGIEGEMIKILPDMVKFETKLPEGVVSIEFPLGTMYFDTNMGDDLLAEGFAREIIRRIQQMRKELGLDPQEFINLKVKMGEGLLDLLDEWLENIADSTRASQMEIVEEIEEEDYIVEWPVKEETVTIGITSLQIKKAMDQFIGIKEVDKNLALAIVESGITNSTEFLETDREELLKIPGMNHSKLRKIKEYFEASDENRDVANEELCPLCNGYIEPGSAVCQRCGKDLIGDEDPYVELVDTFDTFDEEDYEEQKVREKVRIERKKKHIEKPHQPEDEIIRMATEEPRPEVDNITSEIMDCIEIENFERREMPVPEPQGTEPRPENVNEVVKKETQVEAPEELQPETVMKEEREMPLIIPVTSDMFEEKDVSGIQDDSISPEKIIEEQSSKSEKEQFSSIKEPVEAPEILEEITSSEENIQEKSFKSGKEKVSSRKGDVETPEDLEESTTAEEIIKEESSISGKGTKPSTKEPVEAPEDLEEITSSEEIIPEKPAKSEMEEAPSRKEDIDSPEEKASSKKIKEPAPLAEKEETDISINNIPIIVPIPVKEPADDDSLEETITEEQVLDEPDLQEEEEAEPEHDMKSDIIGSEKDRAISQMADTFEIKHSAAKTLYANGYTTTDSLLGISEDDLRKVKGVGKITARRIVQKLESENTKMCMLCNAIVPDNSNICSRCGVAFASEDEKNIMTEEQNIAIMKSLEKKLKKKPSDSTLLLSKAMTLKDAGKDDEALIVLDDALELSPNETNLLALKDEILQSRKTSGKDITSEDETEELTPGPVTEGETRDIVPEPVIEEEIVADKDGTIVSPVVESSETEKSPQVEPSISKSKKVKLDSKEEISLEPAVKEDVAAEKDETIISPVVESSETEKSPQVEPSTSKSKKVTLDSKEEVPPEIIEPISEPNIIEPDVGIIANIEEPPTKSRTSKLDKANAEVSTTQAENDIPEIESKKVILESKETSIVKAESVAIQAQPPIELGPVPEPGHEDTVIENNTIIVAIPEIIPLPEPIPEVIPPEEPEEPEIKLKGSFTYLIPEDRSAKSYQLFKMKIDKGMPGYCVTRTFPEKIRDRYDLGETPILWLSNVAKEDAVRPKDLEKLSLSLEEFLGKEGGIILLDGIEYLITNNNFITVLKLIQSLRDQVAINRSILLLSINPSTMDSHQINLLKREVDSVIE